MLLSAVVLVTLLTLLVDARDAELTGDALPVTGVLPGDVSIAPLLMLLC